MNDKRVKDEEEELKIQQVKYLETYCLKKIVQCHKKSTYCRP